MSDVKIKIPYQLGWTLVKVYNNSGNTNSSMLFDIDVNKVDPNTSTAAVSSVVAASASADVSNSTVLKDFLSATKDVTRKEDFSSTTHTIISLASKLERALEATKIPTSGLGIFKGVGLVATTRVERFIGTMDIARDECAANALGDHICKVSDKTSDINLGQGELSEGLTVNAQLEKLKGLGKGRWVFFPPCRLAIFESY
ncbi:hypothetical protein OQA88_13191 [Cercophora sp. LCS_1]